MTTFESGPDGLSSEGEAALRGRLLGIFQNCADIGEFAIGVTMFKGESQRLVVEEPDLPNEIGTLNRIYERIERELADGEDLTVVIKIQPSNAGWPSAVEEIAFTRKGL